MSGKVVVSAGMAAAVAERLGHSRITVCGVDAGTSQEKTWFTINATGSDLAGVRVALDVPFGEDDVKVSMTPRDDGGAAFDARIRHCGIVLEGRVILHEDLPPYATLPETGMHGPVLMERVVNDVEQVIGLDVKSAQWEVHNPRQEHVAPREFVRVLAMGGFTASTHARMVNAGWSHVKVIEVSTYYARERWRYGDAVIETRLADS